MNVPSDVILTLDGSEKENFTFSPHPECFRVIGINYLTYFLACDTYVYQAKQDDPLKVLLNL